MKSCLALLFYVLLYTSRYHQASHSPSRASWWREAYLRLDLRRDSWCTQNLPRECETFVLHVIPSLIFLYSRLFAILSLTRNTLSGKLSQHSMSSTLSSDRGVRCMASVLKLSLLAVIFVLVPLMRSLLNLLFKTLSLGN